MGWPRSERRRSFSARYSGADSGSGSMSEMEEESKVRQQCFGKVAEIILLAQNKMLNDSYIPFLTVAPIGEVGPLLKDSFEWLNAKCTVPR